jgi:hypothetical protein
MAASITNVEGFDPTEWDIRREGRVWSHEEFNRRIYQAPEKIEFTGGIFTFEDDRLTVLAMLLENLGIDKAVQLGNLADWKAAIAELEIKEHS